MPEVPPSYRRFETYVRKVYESVGDRLSLREMAVIGLRNAWWVGAVTVWVTKSASLLWLIVGAVVVGKACTALADSWDRSYERRQARKDPSHREYWALITDFHAFTEANSLGERLHPAIGALLEECAGHLEWIQREFQLASQDRRVMLEPLMPACEQAMRRAVLLARSSFRPRGLKKKIWAAEIERNPEGLPEAQELKEILSHLEEVRAAVGNLGETLQLREALAHLSELQAAQDELDEPGPSLSNR